jgi:hypothetical protein
MGEAYIIIAVITFFTQLGRSGFFIATLSAVFWPIGAIVLLIFLLYGWYTNSE